MIAQARQATQPETKAPELVGLFTIYSAQTPQLYVDIDRTQCEKLGVDMQDAFDTLQVYMGTYYVNLFNKFGRTWQVNLSADQKYRTDERYLKMLKVGNKLGSMVPLGAVATVRPITGPVMVMRYNMYTSAPINGAPAPGVSSGQALEALEKVTVSGEVVAHTKGPKIRIHKFKNKTGYHKRQGHRQQLTVLKVTGIK